jgi:hypothetical protein
MVDKINNSFYECKRCFHRFYQKNDMNKHLNKKKICIRVIESYKYEEEELYNLSLKRIKNNKKQFICVICNKNFCNKFSLNRHIEKLCKNNISNNEIYIKSSDEKFIIINNIDKNQNNIKNDIYEEYLEETSNINENSSGISKKYKETTIIQKNNNENKDTKSILNSKNNIDNNQNINNIKNDIYTEYLEDTSNIYEKNIKNKDIVEKNNNGIIYLIQPSELIGTNRFKIGMSNNSDLIRCKTGYKKGSKYIFITECNEPCILERLIIKIFKDKFKLICGKEYFEGNEKDMFDTLYKIVTKYKYENLFLDSKDIFYKEDMKY